MVQLGADVEQLDGLARTFRTEGARLERSAASLRSLVGGVRWSGPDADRFRGQFGQGMSPQLVGAARALLAEAGSLTRQAAEQRSASSAGTGEAGAVGAGGGGAEAAGAASPAPFSDQVGGRDPRAVDLDLARMADNVYEPTAAVGNWRRLSGPELAAIGLRPGDLENPSGSGLRASVYESNGRYVLAFAGTNSGGDIGADAYQAFGLPTEQYHQASAIAQKASAAFGDNLVFTGHSLGGGLASYAALQTGRPAVTFNAAGLHDLTLGSTPGTFGPDDPDEARQRAANGLVRSYHVANEPLSSAQEGSGIDGYDFLPDAVGHRIELSEPGFFSKFTGHGISTVIESMERDQPWAR
jgi:hypothetical protein